MLSIRDPCPWLTKETARPGGLLESRDMSRSEALPGFQNVPNLGEQNFLRRWPCGSSSRRLLEPVHLFDNQEQAESDNQEFDYRVYKQSVGKYGHPSIGG